MNSRRQSVLTTGTNDSCLSPTNMSEELEDGMVCLDEKGMDLRAAALESFRLMNAMKSQPLFHSSQSQPCSLFSSPVSSHRNSLADAFAPSNGLDPRYMGLKLPTVPVNDLSPQTVTNGQSGPNPFSDLLLNSLATARLQPLIGSTAPSLLSDTSAFHQVNNAYKGSEQLDLQITALRALLDLNGLNGSATQPPPCAISNLVNQQLIQQILLQSYANPLNGIPTTPTTPTTSAMVGLNGLSLSQPPLPNGVDPAVIAALQNLASKSEQATMLNL